jgi:predicted ATPase
MLPSRQVAFLKLLQRMENTGHIQVLMATHSPMLMAYPRAQLLRLSNHGLDPIGVMETDHYRLMQEFCADPATFIDNVLAD